MTPKTAFDCTKLTCAAQVGEAKVELLAHVTFAANHARLTATLAVVQVARGVQRA